MTKDRLTISDYPLAEARPDLVKGKRGKTLDEITLEGVLDGRVTMEDLGITGSSLLQQAEIARAAGRSTLAANFERAAELVLVPQETIMRVYELLRPGRAKTKQDLLNAASELRERHGAARLSDFVAEAAEVYESRGLFKNRY